MKVAVHAIGETMQSKVSGFPTRRITFKKLYPEDGPGYVYLNQDQKWVEHKDWNSVIELGNVLEVQLQPGSTSNISIFKRPTLIRKASNE